MTSVTIELSDSMIKELEKRAKAEMTSVNELIVDIIRRSMLSYKGNTSVSADKVDDALVSVFSRKRTGKDMNKTAKIEIKETPFYESEFG